MMFQIVCHQGSFQIVYDLLSNGDSSWLQRSFFIVFSGIKLIYNNLVYSKDSHRMGSGPNANYASMTMSMPLNCSEGLRWLEKHISKEDSMAESDPFKQRSWRGAVSCVLNADVRVGNNKYGPRTTTRNIS